MSAPAGARSKASSRPSPFPIASASVNGFLGGGQIGYNVQNGIVVFGVEADASWTNLTGTTPCLIALSCQRDIDFLGTITGRVGVTADRALIYVKGGAAWAHIEHEVSAFGFPVTSADKTVWGWTVGTGVEYAITGNWSAKIEYNFMDFGKNTLSFATPIPGRRHRRRDDVLCPRCEVRRELPLRRRRDRRPLLSNACCSRRLPGIAGEPFFMG